MARDLKPIPTPMSVLEFESPTAALIAMPVKPVARVMSLLVAALVFSCIGAAAMIPVDKIVVAQGKLVSTAPTEVVQPLETAIIRSIDVKEGDIVHTGDLLARLDPTFATADAASLQEQVVSLTAEVDRLTAETAGKAFFARSADPSEQLQAAIYAQRHAERQFKDENYAQKINSLTTQIAGYETAATYYRERLGVASGVEAMRRELERLQVGSKLNSLSAVDNRLEMARDLANSQSSAASARRDLGALIAERDGDQQDWKAKTSQDLTDAGRKLADAKEQLKKATLRKQLVELRAKSDSRVLSIARFSVGSVMQSGDQLMQLVPLDAPLEVEAYLLGRDSGYVTVGDPVVIKLDTFPFTQYGTVDGTVRRVSADSFMQSGALPPIGQTQRSTANGAGQGQTMDTALFYRSTISLDKVNLHDTPDGFHMVPGMPVTAEVKVGKRTVLGYIFSQVLPVVHEGMREP
jgi:HlyD family secretion protein